jgi:hypothetical protein
MTFKSKPIILFFRIFFLRIFFLRIFFLRIFFLRIFFLGILFLGVLLFGILGMIYLFGRSFFRRLICGRVLCVYRWIIFRIALGTGYRSVSIAYTARPVTITTIGTIISNISHAVTRLAFFLYICFAQAYAAPELFPSKRVGYISECAIFTLYIVISGMVVAPIATVRIQNALSITFIAIDDPPGASVYGTINEPSIFAG